MTNGLAVVLSSAFVALTIGSCIRWLGLRSMETGSADSRLGTSRLKSSLVVWWILLSVFAVALIVGRPGLSVLFGTACLIGLYEFHNILNTRSQVPRNLMFVVALVGIIHYALIVWFDPLRVMLVTVHVLFVCICIAQIMAQRTRDYVRTTAGCYWFAILLIVGLSHAVALTALPVSTDPWNAGVVGWTLFLVLLTESNDIAQALIGRRLGKRKILPHVSPGKTWEGLGGGVAVTALLSACLAGPLTTLTENRAPISGILISLLCGMVLALLGFLGDLNISALKREAGIKDSSHLLPGMGGMLDRLDSLSFAAPSLFYFGVMFG